MFSEHGYNSFSPKYPSQASQSVLKIRTFLRGIPRLDKQGTFPVAILDIPCPHHRIQPQAHHCRPFGSFVLPGLRLLCTNVLFGVFECVFDTPAAGKNADYIGAGKFYICAEKEVVFLFAFRVAADYKQHRLLRNLVPYNYLLVDQTNPFLATLLCFYPSPGFHSLCQFSWCRQPSAFLGFGTSFACQAEMGPLRVTIYPLERQAFTILNTSFAFYTIKCYSSSVELTFISGLSSKSRGHDQKYRYH